jgi:hypothetical protein
MQSLVAIVVALWLLGAVAVSDGTIDETMTLALLGIVGVPCILVVLVGAVRLLDATAALVV